MDLFQFLSTIPWVSTHPWVTATAVPAVFWAGAHIMANVTPPVAGKSNQLWLSIYPILNTYIAANYNHATNLAPLEALLEADAPKAPVVVVPVTVAPVSNTVTKTV